MGDKLAGAQSQRKIACLAPAKLNLTLKVIGRQKNGLHLLRSVICPLSLADQIELERTEDKGVYLECLFSPELEKHLSVARKLYPEAENAANEMGTASNLAMRAGTAFLESHPHLHDAGVRIRLLKRIPFQAGLGGGSSDAAAVLTGLCSLFGEGHNLPLLLSIAQRLGSDVPALLCRQLAFIHGTGNKLVPLRTIERSGADRMYEGLGLVIVKPPSGVSTGEAYEALGFSAELEEDSSSADSALTRDTADARLLEELSGLGLEPDLPVETHSTSEKNLTFARQEGSSGLPGFSLSERQLLGRFANDFEPVVFSRYSEVDEARRLLKAAGATRVLLAGSGSAVIGFTLSRDQACGLAEKVRAEAGQGWFVTEAALVMGLQAQTRTDSRGEIGR